MRHFNIAVDGPSGAGKSTLSRRLPKDSDASMLTPVHFTERLLFG